jgi:hypothetical protein
MGEDHMSGVFFLFKQSQISNQSSRNKKKKINMVIDFWSGGKGVVLPSDIE